MNHFSTPANNVQKQPIMELNRTSQIHCSTKSLSKGNGEGIHFLKNMRERSLKITLKRTLPQVSFKDFVKFDLSLIF